MKSNIPIEKHWLAGIYEIRNLVNEKIYVGSAAKLRGRYTTHIRDLTLGRHTNKPLLRAYEKYGSDAFEFNVLCIVDKEPENTFKIRLLEQEEYYIQSREAHVKKNGYNIKLKADSNIGLKFAGRPGELSHLSKFNNRMVLAMVREINLGITREAVMKKYLISKSHLGSIMSGQFWGHVTGIMRKQKSDFLPPNATISAELALSIAEQIRNGYADDEIATKLHTTAITVKFIRIGRTWGKITGFPRIHPKKPNALDIDKVLKIKFLLEEGRSLNQVAKEIGIAKSTALFIKNGQLWGHITGYPRKEMLPLKIALTKEQKMAVVTLRQQGHSVIDLIKRFGVSKSTILKASKSTI